MATTSYKTVRGFLYLVRAYFKAQNAHKTTEFQPKAIRFGKTKAPHIAVAGRQLKHL